MSSYVCQGAKLECMAGSMPSYLNVIHPSKSVGLPMKYMANIMDSKPMQNIMPFGICKIKSSGASSPQPCGCPAISGSWINGKTDVLVKGQPALLNNCLLMCNIGGMIKITNDGQN